MSNKLLLLSLLYNLLLLQLLFGLSNQEAVFPFLQCVSVVGDGTCTATFGYRNPSQRTFNVPVGKKNRFLPHPEYRGQPLVFPPGIHFNVTSFAYNCSHSLVWSMGGKKAIIHSMDQRNVEQTICQGLCCNGNGTTIAIDIPALPSHYKRRDPACSTSQERPYVEDETNVPRPIISFPIIGGPHKNIEFQHSNHIPNGNVTTGIDATEDAVVSICLSIFTLAFILLSLAIPFLFCSKLWPRIVASIKRQHRSQKSEQDIYEDIYKDQ